MSLAPKRWVFNHPSELNFKNYNFQAAKVSRKVQEAFAKYFAAILAESRIDGKNRHMCIPFGDRIQQKN
jgi:hypothetical protein